MLVEVQDPGYVDPIVVDDIDDIPIDAHNGDLDHDDSVLESHSGQFLPNGPLLSTVSLLGGQMTQQIAQTPRTLYAPFPGTIRRGAIGPACFGVKRALNKAKYLEAKYLTSRQQLFGKKAAYELKEFQHDRGLKADGVHGPETHRAMLKFFDRYGVWLLGHGTIKLGNAKDAKRRLVIAAAMLSYNNAWNVHYTQGPYRMYGVRHRLFPPNYGTWEDCSSLATWTHYVAKLPDPNAYGYNGWGYTGTFRNGCKHFEPNNALVADFAMYGRFPFRHTAIVVGRRSNGDVMVVSHGSESGPHYILMRYRSDLSLVYRNEALL